MCALRKTLALFAALGGLLVAPTGHARWLEPSEADYSIESMTRKTQIDSEARFTQTVQIHLKIMNETGRGLGTLNYPYNPQDSELRILKAEIRNGEKTTRVSPQQIVDQPIRMAEQGFDDVRQVSIAFPQVQVGSELRYEMASKALRPPVEGHFSEKVLFGDGNLSRETTLEWISSRPLFVAVNDPTGALEIKQDQQGGRYRCIARLKKPVIHQIFDEPLSQVSDARVTWVIVSTAPDHATLFSGMAQAYEKVIHEPWPSALDSLRKQLKDGPADLSKLERVLATVSEKIRYMGDWRGVNGRLIPRPLQQIAETQSGDCKDMAVLTTRLLRDLGYQAHTALVTRGSWAPTLADVPYAGGFNHAIVHVLFDGKDLWLDPTNFQSFPQGVFEDIIERPALIMDPSRPFLKKIQATPPHLSTASVHHHFHLTPQKTVVRRIELRNAGSMALPETGALLRISKSQFEDNVIATMFLRADLLRFQMSPTDLNDRIVKPVSMQIESESRLRTLDTSMGPALELASPDKIQNLLDALRTQRESDVYLGVPFEGEDIGDYDNIQIKGTGLKNCQVDSPWISYSLKISSRPLRVTRRLEVRRPLIPAEETKKSEFAEFVQKLKDCGRAKLMIFSGPTGASKSKKTTSGPTAIHQ